MGNLESHSRNGYKLRNFIRGYIGKSGTSFREKTLLGLDILKIGIPDICKQLISEINNSEY